MMMQMEDKGCSLVARLTGEMDLQVADHLRSALDSAMGEKGTRYLVLDLSGVSFIDSSGLGVILGRYRRLAQSGGRVSLVGLSPPVKNVLELSGLLRIMREYSSAGEALAGLE
ncbi:MAG TPA: anti-sigma F factor antagonist [Spirochaetia bacterium]|nr:anti-sigma F factor antagonist [Spirochaetia bacterium]